jgi:high-affinity nickel-transport protein
MRPAVKRVWSGYDPGQRRSVIGMATGVAAYILGVRHAFDADHIAAIDNTTRKLMADNGKPMSAGFWFAAGHCTVVFVMVSALGLGMQALAGGIEDGSSGLRRWTGAFGTGVSAVFLLLLGLLNLVSLIGIGRVLRALRRGASACWSAGWASAPARWCGSGG